MTLRSTYRASSILVAGALALSTTFLGAINAHATEVRRPEITSTSKGKSITMSSLSPRAVQGKKAAAGVMKFEGTYNDADIVMEEMDDGFRGLAVINGESAPKDYDFNFALPEGSSIIHTPDSERWDSDASYMIVGADGKYVAQIMDPWARDKNGKDVPVSYELVGDATIRMTVDHEGAAYPVTADPQMTWGNITGTMYFTWYETGQMTTYAGTAAVIAGVCSAWFAVACAIPTGIFSLIAIQASNGRRDFRCLKIKFPTYEPGTYAMNTRICRK